VLPYWESFVIGGRWTGIHSGCIMNAADKQPEEASSVFHERDLISVAELPDGFTAEILFCRDALYAAEVIGGAGKVVKPMAGQTIGHLLRTEGIDDGYLVTVDLQRSP
jgi:hypothetical protein